MVRQYAIFSTKNYTLHCFMVVLTIGFWVGDVCFILTTDKWELEGFSLLVFPMLAMLLFSRASDYRTKNILITLLY